MILNSQQPLLKPLFQPPLYQLKDVDPLAGPLINGVMMKTTMPSAITMVELVVSMKLMDGIITAQYETFLSLTFFINNMTFVLFFIGL